MNWWILLVFDIVSCGYDPEYGDEDEYNPSTRPIQSYYPYGLPKGSRYPLRNPPGNDDGDKPYNLLDLEAKLTQTGQWSKFVKQATNDNNKDPSQWNNFLRNLDPPKQKQPEMQPALRMPPAPRGQPSPGMEMYWSQEESQAPVDPRVPQPPPSYNGQNVNDIKADLKDALRSYNPRPPGDGNYANLPPYQPPQNLPQPNQPPPYQHPPNQPPPTPPPPYQPPQNQPPANQTPVAALRQVPENDMLKMMMKKIQNLEFQMEQQRKIQSPKYLPGFPSDSVAKKAAKILQKALDKLPRVDDFNNPIIWVKFNANETEDGLAQVTDHKTRKNKQVMIQGAHYVPVIDYRLERLGITTRAPTTRTIAALTTHIPKDALRSLMKDQKMKMENMEWLTIEAVVGVRKVPDTCSSAMCHSRCNSNQCVSTCDGDSCDAGCIGNDCEAFCKSEGCHAMCIGDGCKASCSGLSCDARCRGESCEAECYKFSCYQSINGEFKRGGGTFDQWYPQNSPHQDG